MCGTMSKRLNQTLSKTASDLAATVEGDDPI